MGSAYVEEFLNYIRKEKNLSENTIQAYLSDIKQYEGFLSSNGVDIIEANNTNVLMYLLSLQKLEKSSATISRHLASIRCFYEYLEHQGLISEDPTYNLKVPRKKKKQPKILDEQDIIKLISIPDTKTEKGLRDKIILQVAYFTGLRVSELSELSIKDLDLANNTITIKRNDSFKTINLPDDIVNAINIYLREFRNATDENEPLFTNYLGERITRQGLWKIIKSYANGIIDKPVTPQVIRNSFMANLMKEDSNIQSY
ncbi:site-specific tyrosine recombinase XerD [Soehngenia saccharolytica]|nr:site-specific tyrosine recombinase XerD [Soehngenia saccharolytica]